MAAPLQDASMSEDGYPAYLSSTTAPSISATLVGEAVERAMDESQTGRMGQVDEDVRSNGSEQVNLTQELSLMMDQDELPDIDDPDLLPSRKPPTPELFTIGSPG